MTPPATQPSAVVVHVIAHEDSLTDDTRGPVGRQRRSRTQRQAATGDDPARSTDRSAATTDRARGHPAGGADGWRHAARPVVGRQDRGHRQDRADRAPRHDACHEPRYIPSAVLATFIRCRDMTCRFPGCDEPAQHCDIDHTIAYPTGPTQASNLKCLCRKHHLLKTFGGWRDQQQPDGTVVWTSPHGPDLHHPPRQPNTVPHPVPTHRPRRRTVDSADTRHRRIRPRADDAPPQPHPRPKPRTSHQRRTHARTRASRTPTHATNPHRSESAAYEATANRCHSPGTPLSS